MKDIRHNVKCLTKQQIKDVVAYLSFNCYFTVVPQIFCQVNDVHMSSNPAPFLPINFYIFMKFSEWAKQKDWPNVGKNTLGHF